MLENLLYLHQLFPGNSSKTPEENAIFTSRLSGLNQDDVKAAIEKHRAESKFKTCEVVDILAAYKVIRAAKTRPPDSRYKKNVTVFRQYLHEDGMLRPDMTDDDIVYTHFQNCREKLEACDAPEIGKQAMRATMRSALRCSLYEIGHTSTEAAQMASEFMGIAPERSFMETIVRTA